ncbi:hypothetical protein [Nostoc sp. NMS9]|uniref:hypothetical protein n=1 Tax=Nostoc sp. NMS9 TaxID=2815393 RepID=UPI0025CDE01D|nr:hypothetical protein [Nostoc sp. NMS9]
MHFYSQKDCWVYLICGLVVAMATTWFITYAGSAVASWFLQTFGYGWILFWGIISLMCGSFIGSSALKQGYSVGWAVGWAVGGAVISAGSLSSAVISAVGWAVAWAVSGAVGWAVVWAVEWVIDLAEDLFTTVLILLILGFGASVGTGIIAGFLNPFILLALTATSLPALSMLVYSPLKRRRLIAKYRKSEESLIKP